MSFSFKSWSRKKAACVVLIFSLASAVGVRACFAEQHAKDPVAAAKKAVNNNLVETEWALRCVDEKGQATDKKTGANQCEVFKLLQVAGAKGRVAEFALSFPDKKNPEQARAGVILPLGVLLEPGVLIKVDDETLATTHLQYCTMAGCTLVVNMDRDRVKTLEKGKILHFYLRAMNGQNMDFTMRLDGFGKALKQTL